MMTVAMVTGNNLCAIWCIIVFKCCLYYSVLLLKSCAVLKMLALCKVMTVVVFLWQFTLKSCNTWTNCNHNATALQGNCPAGFCTWLLLVRVSMTNSQWLMITYCVLEMGCMQQKKRRKENYVGSEAFPTWFWKGGHLGPKHHESSPPVLISRLQRCVKVNRCWTETIHR
jgi:hypothetical protein